MSVTLSKPPKPIKVVAHKDASSRRAFRWRSAEERRAAKREIERIRRETEQERLKLGLQADASVLRSPKVLLGLLAVLLLLGGGLVVSLRKPAQHLVQTTPLNNIRARRSVTIVAKAMTLFRVHTGSWPQQRLGLYALAKDYDVPGWKGPYINWAYKDPWGTPYVYRMPQSPFEVPVLFSCGPDGKPDTNDDIRATEADFVCAEGTWRREHAPEAESSADETRKEETR